MTLEEVGIKTKQQAAYVTTCPNCSSGRKPENRKLECLSVKVLPEYSIWNCHNCSWSGSTLDHEKYEGVRNESRMPKEKKNMYSKQVLDWLATKQISGEVAMEDGVYEVDGYGGNKEVAFPYYYKNQLVNVMFRRLVYDATKQSKVYQIGKKYGTLTCFWGLHKLDLEKNKDVIITEGQTDRLTWLQCGYTNVLSIPMGASKSNSNIDKKLEFITDPYILKLFQGVRRFYVAMDGDETGIAFKEVLIDKLGRTRCFVIAYPPGYKDSNEVYAGDVKKNLDPKGKTGIEDLYKESQPYPIRGIIRFNDVRPYLDQLSNKGFEKGYITNKKEYDELISVKRKLLMGITGIPGQGKSAVSRDYLVNLCKTNSWMKFALFTPESRPPQREYAKLTEVYMGKSHWEYHPNAMNRAEKDHGYNWVSSRFVIVNPTTKNYENLSSDKNSRPQSLINLLYYFKHLKNSLGIFGFVIDAWNKIDHFQPQGISETNFVSKQLDYILDFLDLEDLFGLIIAHPTKMERARGGNYKMPSLYDIKGSSAWNEKLDIGAIAYRKKYFNTGRKNSDGDEIWEIDKTAPTTFRIEKMKFDELGEEGEVDMYMDKRNGDTFSSKKPPIFMNEHNNKTDTPDDELPF